MKRFFNESACPSLTSLKFEMINTSDMQRKAWETARWKNAKQRSERGGRRRGRAGLELPCGERYAHFLPTPFFVFAGPNFPPLGGNLKLTLV